VRLVMASANPHKAAEIAEVLGDRYRIEPRPATLGEVEETGSTLEDNARLKAVAVAAATGEAAVADDTGLEVDALDGRPGIYSARWAGPDATYADNVNRLLAELDGVDPARRGARFRTVAIVVFPGGSEVRADGVVEGRIADAARGDKGFGYDPVFVPDGGGGRTFAEMAPAAKHALSHRGRAFRRLATALAALDQ